MSGRSGIPFVVAAPSGTGKTTVCRRVLERDARVEFSVSHTTRPRRPGEVDGRDYHFVAPDEFRRLEAQGAFLESARYNDNSYGTSWASIEEPLQRGCDVLLEIEIQGAAQVRKRRSDARFIFLVPPSMKILEERLRERGTESEEQVQRRLRLAGQEVEAILGFDYAVVNDALDACVAEVLEILGAEREGRPESLAGRFDPAAALERLRSTAG